MDKGNRFGDGERVRFRDDWPGPDFPNAACTVPKGATATVLTSARHSPDCYLVRLDEAIPGWQPEVSVQGFDLEPE
jgi:hypothetical protein